MSDFWSDPLSTSILHVCEQRSSPEPSLVAYAVSTIISWAGSFYAVSLVCVPFPLGVMGRMWNSIVSIPDYSLFIYFEPVRLPHWQIRYLKALTSNHSTTASRVENATPWSTVGRANHPIIWTTIGASIKDCSPPMASKGRVKICKTKNCWYTRKLPAKQQGKTSMQFFHQLA